MAVKTKSLKVSKAQLAFMRGLAGEKGIYVPRYPSSRTGVALAKKGFVEFHWGVNRWGLTYEGLRFLGIIGEESASEGGAA
ncbi:hypothetical protein [Enterobacter roggenkampii]|uniref:hypothetical protein n=1 Tax=Enterobacter roggenkampii TaxID=1812935 RepID=UPI002A80D61B|nr:hypothetical protein [Enterobacter roggenkampii]